MTLSTSYNSINSLGDYPLIAGSTYTIRFTVLDQNSASVDISGATCTWRLAEYGTNEAVLTKTGSITATNVFAVILSEDDTADLSGKYSHQPRIVMSDGNVLMPAQGILTIIKGIN